VRRPGWSLRTQLTLLYAGPFLVTGALLIVIPLSQTSQTSPVGVGGPTHPPQPDSHVQRVLVATVIALAVLVLVALVIGWLIAGRFLRPLRTITATARDISASNLNRRLGRTGRASEFTDLAATLDDLFGRLEAAFESQRHFVANASHELRTPLTAERTLLQVALADPDADTDALRAACREVLLLGEQQERLIEALLTLADSEQGVERREAFDLAAIVDDVVLARSEEIGRRGLRLETALAPATVTGDPKLVESLVTNLVDNAIRHNLPAGRIEVATSGTSLRVGNTGPPIRADEVESLFEPFRQLGGDRTRRAGGHGLGLAIVRAIAAAHGATLVTRPGPGGGLTIEVTFPG
jgi:signal transduction histidine kinase